MSRDDWYAVAALALFIVVYCIVLIRGITQ